MRFEINTGQKLELILLVDKKQIEDDKDKEVTTKQPEQPIVEKTNLNPNNAALSIWMNLTINVILKSNICHILLLT